MERLDEICNQGDTELTESEVRAILVSEMNVCIAQENRWSGPVDSLETSDKNEAQHARCFRRLRDSFP